MPSQPLFRLLGFRRRRLTGPFWRVACALLALACVPVLPAEDAVAESQDRSDSYYHFALGHLYHQFAQQFMRDEYVRRAVEEYEAALEGDPQSDVIRTEMINLFAGANQLEKAEAIAEQMFAENPEDIDLHRLMGRVYRSYASKPRQGWDLTFLGKAIEKLERVTELEPDKAENHLELGVLYRFADRLQEAEKSLRRSLELDPGQTEAEVTLANLLLQSGQHRAAIEVLERIVADEANREPRHVDTLASAYQQVGRFADAATLLEQLVQRGGDTLQIRRRLAESLFLSRQFSKALEQYQLLAEAAPRNPEHHLRISQIEQQANNMDRAWEALEAARRLDPANLQVQFQAVSLLQAEGKAEEAVTEIERILREGRKAEYSPEERRRRSMLLESWAKLLRQLKRHEDAVSAYGEIARLNPDTEPRVMAEIVETWRAAGEFARAEQEARGAVKAFSGNTMLQFQLASVLSDRGKTREAIRTVQRSMPGEGADIDSLLTMARIYEKARQFDKAAVQVDLASELVKTDPERVGVLFAYGSLHERAKDYDKAESHFRELLEMDPRNASALNYLGYMFADLGVHLEEAHDLIQKALDIEPDNGAYLDSLGWVYYRQGKLDLAAKYLERSLRQYEDDPVVHSHLGDVYFKQGRAADAKEHWSRALEAWGRAAPSERDAAEIESLKRKLAELEVSIANRATGSKKKESVERP